MQFTVPKFLERESIIAFGLNFKNLALLAGLGFILFILYYILPQIAFILLAIIFGGGFLAATFIKVGGQSLPQLMFHSFGFLFSGRVYTWSRGQNFSPVKLVKKTAKPKEEKKEAPLRIAPKSHLASLSSKIDFTPQRSPEEQEQEGREE
ncbi:MAG: hypothetical protein AAB842_00825 [Patescibacteria group bacterium]